MPSKSKRKILMEKIILKGLFSTLEARNLQKLDHELLQTVEEFSCVVNYRYSIPRLHQVPRSKDWYTNVLPCYDEDRLKSCVRVTRAQFAKIMDLLKPLPVFKTTSHKALPLEVQLAVSLFRFGNEGSGASYERVGQLFGISEAGMIKLCIERVIKGLLSLQQRFIAWPGKSERRQICENMESILPGCIGYIDVCHVPLYEAPLNDHEAYHSRKQQYGIQLQALCDNVLVFRNVTVGYPASAHDARVFVNSPIGQYPERFLDDGQWIAADSAYRSSKYIVTPFRENATSGTLSQRRKFNRHFSSMTYLAYVNSEFVIVVLKTHYVLPSEGQRVKIEQSFGMLKKIFGSLRSLRIRVDKKNGHRRACEWILSCIILYNIMKPGTYETLHEDVQDTDVNAETSVDIGDGDCVQRDTLF